MAKVKKVKDITTTEVKFSEVKDWYDEHLDPDKIDFDDQDVYKHIYHDGRFAGIFQCVDAEANIELYSNEKGNYSQKLKNVVPGDIVISLNEITNKFEQKEVLNVFDKGIKECLTITLENNEKLTCTYDHRILTNNRGWVEAQDLNETDDIVIFNSL